MTDTWRANAACLGHPEAWIFDATIHAPRDELRQAGLVCAKCTVKEECAAWAKAESGFEGVAGGWLWRAGARGKPIRWAPCLPI